MYNRHIDAKNNQVFITTNDSYTVDCSILGDIIFYAEHANQKWVEREPFNGRETNFDVKTIEDLFQAALLIKQTIEDAQSSPVPNSVTKRQGRQQMILLGLLDQVHAAIDSIPDPIQKAMVQSFWDDSNYYDRNHPQMIQLSAAVGMTEEQLDQAFIAASQL